MTSTWLLKQLSNSSDIFDVDVQTQNVELMKCVATVNTDGALHRVSDIESHFPVVATVKKGKNVKHVHTFEDPKQSQTAQCCKHFN